MIDETMGKPPLRSRGGMGNLKAMKSDRSFSVSSSNAFEESAWQEEWVQNLISKSQKLETLAIEAGDVETCVVTKSMIIALLQVRQLQNYFHRSPSRSIQGPGGVAEQLNVTRNAVYKKLEALGLDIKDFRVPLPYGKLIHESKRIPGMIEDVERRFALYKKRSDAHERSKKPR